MKNYNYYILLLIVLLISCKKETKNNQVIKEKNTAKKDTIYKLTNSKVNSEGAFIFNNNDKLLINWTEWDKHNKSNLLKFAFFDKSTNKFLPEITVTPSLGLQMHAESMAKIGITKKGFLYAVYRRKSKNSKSRFGGFVCYAISKDSGKTWSDEKILVTDKTSTSQSFFDIALLPDGELGMVWLDSRKPIDKNHKGKTLYFAKTNLDKGFINEKPIAGSTCECCRTDIYVDNQNTIHLAYRNLIDPKEPYFDGQGTMEIRDMFYLFSDDNGKTFSKPVPISQDNWHVNGCPHTGPSLTNNGNNLAATWYTGKENEDGIYYATSVNNKFNPKKLLTRTGHHPQMISNFGKNYIVYETYYENNNKGYNKIQLEEINDTFLRKSFEISDKFTNNNHAVITPFNNNTLLIAWVNTDTRNPKIMYKTFVLN